VMNAAQDLEYVEELLGRKPQCEFEVVVRRTDGSPVVIKNFPVLFSGRPMPTMYWLVDPVLTKCIGRIESGGGVDEAEEAIGYVELEKYHLEYANKRQALFDESKFKHIPTGGVGGTRKGVKCLHAHFANFLVDGVDPVGLWTNERLLETNDGFDPSVSGIATIKQYETE